MTCVCGSQVVTTVTQNFDDVMTFPAVTLCNFNRVHCRNLYDHIRELNSTNSSSSNNTEKIFNLCTIYNGGLCGLNIATDDMFVHGEVKLESICENS